MSIDPMAIKAFLITGTVCTIGVVASMGLKNVARGNHPIQLLVTSFLIGGVGGTVVWWLFLRTAE